MGLVINFVLLFLSWFGIHLHLVIANKILTNLLKVMLNFNPYCWLALHNTWTPTIGEVMHIIPHNLLSDERMWAQQVVGNNVNELAKGGSSCKV